MRVQITMTLINVKESVRQNCTVLITIEQILVSLAGTKFNSSVEVSLKLSSKKMK